jgi:hypothetical protein
VGQRVRQTGRLYDARALPNKASDIAGRAHRAANHVNQNQTRFPERTRGSV